MLVYIDLCPVRNVYGNFQKAGLSLEVSRPMRQIEGRARRALITERFSIAALLHFHVRDHKADMRKL